MLREEAGEFPAQILARKIDKASLPLVLQPFQLSNKEGNFILEMRNGLERKRIGLLSSPGREFLPADGLLLDLLPKGGQIYL